MVSIDTVYNTKHFKYSILLAAVISWPWIWKIFSGSNGEGDLVDLISLGMLPALIIGAFILYKETKSHSASYRWAFAVTLIAAFLLVWIIPAVGIYGRSGDPVDLPYYGVLAIGILGGIISRFGSRGMAITLFAMAISQVLVEVSGLFSGLGTRVILNSFFTVLWVSSALLFWHAARKQETSSQMPDRNNTTTSGSQSLS